MPKYLIQCIVESAEGCQYWSVEAENEEDAIEKYNAGDGEFSHEEVEVTSLGKPEVIEVE